MKTVDAQVHVRVLKNKLNIFLSILKIHKWKEKDKASRTVKLYICSIEIENMMAV